MTTTTATARKTHGARPPAKRFADFLREWAEEFDLDEQDVADPWVHQDESPLGRDQHKKLAREGKLPAYKPDRYRVLIRRSHIDKWIEAHPMKVRARPLSTLAPARPPENLVTDNREEKRAALRRELGLVKKAGA
jgi:excisionase family DNA binding protein